MLFIDDLLLAPMHGLMWVFREINDIVEKERSGEGAKVTHELSELYMRLDSGAISEEQFTAEESRLLDRLDAFAIREGADEDEDESNGDSENDETDQAI